MKKFDDLLEIAEKLNGPGGCPWDQTQTFLSLQPYIIEEAHEVLEAVDSGDDRKIVEELGDLFYTVIFYAKVAKKEGRFSIEDILDAVSEKLIRRHPHVFGDLKVEDVEQVLHHWEKIKKGEKAHEERKSALDGIPKTLPALVRAQKIVKKIRRAGSPLLPPQAPSARTEQEVGQQFLEVLLAAEDAGVDAESALRRALNNLETEFRKTEVQPAKD